MFYLHFNCRPHSRFEDLGHRSSNRLRPQLRALEQRELPAIFIPNIYDPVGAATDQAGNVYVSFEEPVLLGTAYDAMVAEYSPQGVLLRQSTVEPHNPSNPLPPGSGDLIPGPGPSGDMWDLQPDGIIYDISNTGVVSTVFNLKTGLTLSQIDESNIIDIQTGMPNSLLGGEIFPTLPGASYGDIVIRGSSIFVTGYSPNYSATGVGDHKFIEQITVTSPTTVSAKILLSSSASPTSGGFGSFPNGLAINPDGILVTTLPYSSSGVLTQNYDALVEYNLNGLSKPVVLGGVSVPSQGMAIDNQGDVLIAAYLNDTGGPHYGLIVINRTLDNLNETDLAGFNAFTLGSTGDVAAAPNQASAYVAIPGLNEVISTQYNVPPRTTVTSKPTDDFDGVGHTQLAVFRPATAQWFIDGEATPITFGDTQLRDIPVPGDYDGTGHTELAVFRPSTAQWFISGHATPISFGDTQLRDIPVPGDYDGTGHTELAVFRPSTAQWFISGHATPITFGDTQLRDIPLPGPAAFLKAKGLIGGMRASGKVTPTVSPIPPKATHLVASEEKRVRQDKSSLGQLLLARRRVQVRSGA